MCMNPLLENSSLKHKILNDCDQIELFSIIMDIPYNIIEDCIINDRNIPNPKRIDDNPSLTFYIKEEGELVKVRMFDAGNNFYSGDIFDIATKLLRIQDKSFNNICKELISLSTNKQTIINNSKTLKTKSKVKKGQTIITIYSNDVIYNYDYKYWYQGGIDRQTLDEESNFGVVDYFFIDNTRYTFDRKATDRGYYYYLGKDPVSGIDLYKIYMPDRKKPFTKFITNNPYPLEELYMIKGGHTLILIKSRKDKMVLKNILAFLFFSTGGEKGYDIVCFSSESILLSKEVGNTIKNRYKYVFVFSDNDRQGKANMYYHRKRFGFIPIMIPTTKKAKDIFDYVKTNKFLPTSIDVLDTISFFKQKIGYENNNIQRR